AELNRFLAEALGARQPPLGGGGARARRLKPIFITQIGSRPPRFAVQVNARGLLTREYSYFLENRLRARYGLEGVPLVVDFVERGQRAARERGVRMAEPFPAVAARSAPGDFYP